MEPGCLRCGLDGTSTVTGRCQGQVMRPPPASPSLLAVAAPWPGCRAQAWPGRSRQLYFFGPATMFFGIPSEQQLAADLASQRCSAPWLPCFVRPPLRCAYCVNFAIWVSFQSSSQSVACVIFAFLVPFFMIPKFVGIQGVAHYIARFAIAHVDISLCWIFFVFTDQNRCAHSKHRVGAYHTKMLARLWMLNGTRPSLIVEISLHLFLTLPYLLLLPFRLVHSPVHS